MKKFPSIVKYLFFGIVIVSLAACTEEIDIDLNSSEPQIVIEGSVATNGEPVKIKITQSVNFDENNDFPAVENALVTISDDLGNSELVPESAPGIYSTSSFIGMERESYHLQVEVDEKALSASSTIPAQVLFDTLIVKETNGESAGGPGGFGSITNYDVRVRYSDPEEEINYYRFVEYINGEEEAAYIYNDILTDGITVETSLLRFSRYMESGDTLRIVMQCIDKKVYEYFNSFGNLMGGPANSSTPANPYTNIEGAVLGYFSAHTFEEKQVLIE